MRNPLHAALVNGTDISQKKLGDAKEKTTAHSMVCALYCLISAILNGEN
jgi:hypothetical protein